MEELAGWRRGPPTSFSVDVMEESGAETSSVWSLTGAMLREDQSIHMHQISVGVGVQDVSQSVIIIFMILEILVLALV